jgi:hypothetical protein
MYPAFVRSLKRKSYASTPKVKKSKETAHFVDIKSFMLRDALRGVLHDVPGDQYYGGQSLGKHPFIA